MFMLVFHYIITEIMERSCLILGIMLMLVFYYN
jgi:hypothetical protein